jgi:hypothetical protein
VPTDAELETGDAPPDAYDGGIDATIGLDVGPDVMTDAGLDVVRGVAHARRHVYARQRLRRGQLHSACLSRPPGADRR